MNFCCSVDCRIFLKLNLSSFQVCIYKSRERGEERGEGGREILTAWQRRTRWHKRNQEKQGGKEEKETALLESSSEKKSPNLVTLGWGRYKVYLLAGATFTLSWESSVVKMSVLNCAITQANASRNPSNFCLYHIITHKPLGHTDTLIQIFII